MARAELTESVLQPQGSILTYVTGASVTVNVRGGGAATVYQAATGSSTRTQPLTTNYGRIEPVGAPGGECWLDPGFYDIVVTLGPQTWTQRFDVPAPRAGWFDVREFGALTPAATAQTTIRAACDAAVAYATPSGRSAIVYVPWSVDVDTTAGRCGYFPANIDVEVWAETTGKVNGTSGTVIRRTAGHAANEVFVWEGSNASTNRGFGALRRVRVSSNQAVASKPLVWLNRVNEFTFDDAWFVDCTGTALRQTQVWNSRYLGLRFFRCGNGTANAAMLLEGVTGESSSDTGQYTDVQFELCLGTEVEMTGDLAGNPCNKMRWSNTKVERGGLGHPAGATMDYPIFKATHVTDLVITAPSVYLQTPSGGGTNTSKFLTGGAQSPSTQGVVEVIGGSVVTDGNPTHMMDCTGGNRYKVSTYFQGDNVTTAFVKVASTLNSDAVSVDGMTGSGIVPLVDDQRVDSHLGWGEIKLEPSVLTGAAWAVDGNTPVLEFRDAVDDKAYYVVKLPKDARRQMTVKLECMTSYDNTGGFAFWVATVQRKIALSGTIGDTATNVSAPNAQIAPPATIDQARKNTFTPTLAFSPGELAVIVFQRSGTVTGSDTTTAKARLPHLQFLYQQNP